MDLIPLPGKLCLFCILRISLIKYALFFLRSLVKISDLHLLVYKFLLAIMLNGVFGLDMLLYMDKKSCLKLSILYFILEGLVLMLPWMPWMQSFHDIFHSGEGLILMLPWMRWMHS